MLRASGTPFILDLCSRKTRSGKSNAIVFENSVFKMFSVDTQTQTGVFKFLRSEERVAKAPFSWQISVDGRLKRRMKAAFF